MKFVLFDGRHSHKMIDKLPAIFKGIKDEQVFDFDYHKQQIHKQLKGIDELTLYVTGMTPLLVSVINYCRLFSIPLTLYHYDTSIDSYRAQTVV